MNTSETKLEYLVALTEEGRERDLREELVRVLRSDPRIEILGGEGHACVTVCMTRDVSAQLQTKLSFAIVEPARVMALFD